MLRRNSKLDGFERFGVTALTIMWAAVVFAAGLVVFTVIKETF